MDRRTWPATVLGSQSWTCRKRLSNSGQQGAFYYYFFESALSQLSSARNNPYIKVAHLEATYPDSLQQHSEKLFLFFRVPALP